MTDDDAEKALWFIKNHSGEYAKAKAESQYLERFTKTKKALLMKDSPETSAAGQERDALAHPEYKELLDGLRVAEELAERLKWQLMSAEIQIDIWRTQSSNQRALGKI